MKEDEDAMGPQQSQGSDALTGTLRWDIRVEPLPGNEDFVARLVDGCARRAIKLDQISQATVQALSVDGTRATVLRQVRDALGQQVAEEAVWRVLDTLASYGMLVDGGGLPAGRGIDPETVALRFAPGFSFACTGCGGCCHAQNIGPVDAEVVAAVQSSKEPAIEALHEQYGSLFRRVREEDGATAQLCRLGATGCAFLRDDQGCTIHGSLGSAAKPSLCRLFPYVFIQTPDGVDVSVLLECRDYTAAKAAGQGVAADPAALEAEIRPLLGLPGAIAPLPARIPIAPNMDVSWQDYRAWEEQAIGIISSWREGSFMDLHARIIASLAQAFDVPLGSRRGPSARNDEDSPSSVAVLIDGLKVDLDRVLGDVQSPGDEPAVATQAWMRLLIDASAMTGVYARRSASSDLDEGLRALLRDAYGNHLFAKSWANFGSVALGIAVIGLLGAMSLNLALHFARLGLRNQAVPRDLDDATSVVFSQARHTLLHHVLMMNAEHVLDGFLFEASSLEGAWRELATPWSGPEFYPV